MLKNLKLSFKLAFGFTVVLIMLVGVGCIGITSITNINDRVTNADDMNRIIKYGLTMANERRDFTSTGSKSYSDAVINNLESIKKQASDTKTRFKDTADQQTMDDVINAASRYEEEFKRYVTLKQKFSGLQQSQAAEYEQTKKDISESEKTLMDENNALQDLADKAREGQKAKMLSEMSSAKFLMIGGTVFAVILGIILSFFITRSITKPINLVVSSLSKGSDEVASASSQLSATSQQLAEGSSEQAASIEETSSTLEESSSMIKQNAENTKQAALLAGQTKAAADKGNAEMQDMMESMTEIKKSSDQIAKIIKVIDEIAFQTNILALNAAVEAARAGDAGMGFAVVAEEVRNLAQRSAQAAKDTAAIIESNIELSDKGVDVAKMVGESLADITIQAKKVNELMDEISAASQEQTQGIIQINKAIVQMEKVTQQIAANAEESASASEELNAQAENMNEVVGQLAQLVNGKSTEVTRISKMNSGKPKTSLDLIRHDNHAGFTSSATKTDKSVHNKTHALTNTTGKGKTHLINPEDVIPLEKDSSDF